MKNYGEFRWCLPKFIVYRPAKPSPGDTIPRISLNRYPGAIIGVSVLVFGRVWGVQWKHS